MLIATRQRDAENRGELIIKYGPGMAQKEARLPE
jgi:hypothetical protein